MKIDFEMVNANAFAKVIVTDLTTDEIIENVCWINLSEGIICYYPTDDEGKLTVVNEGEPDWYIRRIVRHGRYNVSLTSNPAHPDCKGNEFEVSYKYIKPKDDRPKQKVIHPKSLPPNTQKVVHRSDLEKEASKDGKQASERTSSEA